MTLFDLVLRDDFRRDSDFYMLVLFDSPVDVTFLTLGEMKQELSGLFQRPVDLFPQDGLKPIIRDSILSSAQVIFVA
jgi:predicted nucleotidyltransferase